MQPTKTLLRAKRGPRQLPQRLRSLAALVELTNLISQAEFERFRGAYLRLFEKEYGLRSTRQPRGADLGLMSFLKRFSARCRAPERRAAMTTLLKYIALATYRSPNEVNPFTLFETIATLRCILRRVAVELNLQSNPVQLPSDTPPVVLGSVDGRIQIAAVPVAYWILPMLDGIEARRLGICDACQRLYVARRRDQLGCSRKCGDTLYMRRYRNPEYRNRNSPDSKRRQIRKAIQELKRSIAAGRTAPADQVKLRKN
jgi:hypothetical protein